MRFFDSVALRLFVASSLPFVLVAIGTEGYHRIEGWSRFDALYMTVITLGTVGFGETHPLSHAGRWFTIVLILGGAFTMAAAITSVIRALISGDVQRLLGRQRMERTLAHLEGHVIVCGYGRMGKLVCEEFTQARQPFVIVDRNSDALRGFESKVGIALAGDGTTDEVLKRAQIDRARALVTVLPHDADNLFITMSARLLSEKIFIVARAEDPTSDAKLERAGANRVVSPYHLGGGRVAQAVLRPAVLDFIDLATRTHHIELQMEETLVRDRCELAGRKLSDSVNREHRVIVVAVKRKSGKMEFNPGGETTVEAGDTLISLGHRHDLDRLEKMAVAG